MIGLYVFPPPFCVVVNTILGQCCFPHACACLSEGSLPLDFPTGFRPRGPAASFQSLKPWVICPGPSGVRSHVCCPSPPPQTSDSKPVMHNRNPLHSRPFKIFIAWCLLTALPPQTFTLEAIAPLSSAEKIFFFHTSGLWLDRPLPRESFL